MSVLNLRSILTLLLITLMSFTINAQSEEVSSGPYQPILCPPNFTNPSWISATNKLFIECPYVNVGVNTSNPRVRMDVLGTTYSTRLALNTDPVAVNSSSTIFRLRGFSASNNASIFEINNVSGGLLSVNNQGVMNLNGQFTMTSFNNKPLIINSSTEKILQLESDGLLRTRRIKVDQNTWADYVFDKEYELMPLEEVALYIEKNKHLPNVPSTSEVQKNGVEVAEMNELLLLKIEELTLYMIDQKKTITDLREDIEQIKASKVQQ